MGLGGGGKTSEDYELYLFPGSVGIQTSHPGIRLDFGIDHGFSHPYTSGRLHLVQQLSWLSQLERWKPSRIGSLLW